MCYDWIMLLADELLGVAFLRSQQTHLPTTEVEMMSQELLGEKTEGGVSDSNEAVWESVVGEQDEEDESSTTRDSILHWTVEGDGDMLEFADYEKGKPIQSEQGPVKQNVKLEQEEQEARVSFFF